MDEERANYLIMKTIYRIFGGLDCLARLDTIGSSPRTSHAHAKCFPYFLPSPKSMAPEIKSHIAIKDSNVIFVIRLDNWLISHRYAYALSDKDAKSKFTESYITESAAYMTGSITTLSNQVCYIFNPVPHIHVIRKFYARFICRCLLQEIIEIYKQQHSCCLKQWGSSPFTRENIAIKQCTAVLPCRLNCILTLQLHRILRRFFWHFSSPHRWSNPSTSTSTIIEINRDFLDQLLGDPPHLAKAQVALFFKQWGQWASCSNWPDDVPIPSGERAYLDGQETDDNESVWSVGKRAAGRLLDGRTHDDFPEVQS